MSSSSSSSSSSGSGTMTTVISDAPTSTEFSFQWDIKSWSALDNRFGKGTSCKSVTGAGYTWNFLVFPGGNVNTETKDYVALFLVGKDVPKKVQRKVEFTITVVNQKGSMDQCCHTCSKNKVENLCNGGYGTHKMVKSTFLLDESNGYIVNDRVLLQCDITVHGTTPAQRIVLPQHLTTTSTRSLKNDLSTLLDTGNNADVTIKVADGAEFHAHATILSARSKVFQAMLNENQMTEAQTKLVSMPDIDPAVFEQLLKFLYTDQCDLSHSFAEALLPLGDRYDVPNLVEHCAVALTSTLNVDNVCDRLIFADAHGSLTSEFREVALRFAAANFSGVQLTSGFLERMLQRPDLTAELFKEKAGTRKRKREEEDAEEDVADAEEA